MSYNIDTIVFDLGGVLVDWDPKQLYRKVFKTEEEVEWFLDNVCTSEWNLQQDGGRTIEEAYRVKIEEFPEHEEQIRLFYSRWDEMFVGLIEDNIAIQQHLIKNTDYKVYALTNWSAELWDFGKKLFPFFKDFDDVIVSGQEKMHKPNDDIFQLLINRFKLDPAKTIFIDDNHANTIASNKNGLNTIHFTNKQTDLKNELAKFGVKI